MKSSTKPLSSKPANQKAEKPAKIKAATVTRVVAGLIFFPTNKTKDHFLSLLDWITAGKPNDAYIFDNADTLKACGIPICDGAPMRGMYRRIPALKPRKTTLTIVPHLIKVLSLGVAKKTDQGVVVSDVKEHHKMSY